MKKDKTLLGIALIFYLIFFLIDGPVLAADSQGYISMQISREPLYPLFLCFFRTLLPDNLYLYAVVLFQSLLAAFAAWYLTVVIHKIFCCRILVLYSILFIQLGISAINRFIANRRALYSSQILTEGLTLSFWILFFCFIFEIAYLKKKSSLILAILMVTLMILTRKQLLLSLPILSIVIFFTYRKDMKIIRLLISIFSGCLMLFLLTTLFGRCYNYILRGDFVGYTDSSNTLFTTMIYSSDREASERISDPRLRKIYLELFDTLDEKCLNYRYAEGGFLMLEEHYSTCYDQIGISTVQPFLKEYAASLGYESPTAQSVHADEIRMSIIKDILPSSLLQMIKVYFSNVLHGFVLTVAKAHTLFYIYTLFIFILYVYLLCRIRKRFKKSAASSFALLVLLCIVCNVFSVAAVIFTQTRYMIYNMALFYIGLLLLCREYLRLFLFPYFRRFIKSDSPIAAIAKKYLPLCLEFIRFGLVGGFNTLLNYVIYFSFLKLGAHYLAANFFAFFLSVFCSNFLNAYFVFKTGIEKKNFFRTLAKVYLSYMGTSLVLNSVLLTIWIDLFGFSALLAPFINLLLLAPINFLLNKLIYNKTLFEERKHIL